MKYSIESKGSDVKITVEQVGNKQSGLMAEFKECAEGRCSCPTPQYAKVEAIEIKPGRDRVDIALKAKPGQEIDQADINKCLEHTAKKVSQCC